MPLPRGLETLGSVFGWGSTGQTVDAGRHFTSVNVHSNLHLPATPEMYSLVNAIEVASSKVVKDNLGDGGWWHKSGDALARADVVSAVSRELEETDSKGQRLSTRMAAAARRSVEMNVQILEMLQQSSTQSPVMSENAVWKLSRIITGPDDAVQIKNRKKTLGAGRFIAIERGVVRAGRNRQDGRKSPVRMYTEDLLGIPLSKWSQEGLPSDFYQYDPDSQFDVLANIVKRRFELSLWEQTNIDEDAALAVAEMFKPHEAELRELAIHAPAHYGLITALAHDPLVRDGEVQNIAPIGILMAKAMRFAGQAIVAELVRKGMDIETPPEDVANEVLRRFSDVGWKKPDQKTIYKMQPPEQAGADTLALLGIYLTHGTLDISVIKTRVPEDAKQAEQYIASLKAYITSVYLAVAKQIAIFAVNSAKQPLDIHQYDLKSALNANDFLVQAQQFIDHVRTAVETNQPAISLPYPKRSNV